ncbi:MAG: sigma-70 region 4 domain-containing protein, partial [Candidatus Thorarchaeota archaeon]|nr:sigma-70 region 4 domain-containing protein [Candidatus Thorarchaeota archaeon]
EHFRECVRDEVETIEDFEELAKKHGLDELLEDEEVMEELRTYLDLRHRLEDEPERNIEELAEELGIDVELAQEWSKGESKPYSLKKLLDLEAFYLWDEILRAYHEQNLPQSREELEKIMRENPQLREDRLFVLERDDAIAWIEIMGMRRRGEIQKRIRNGREIYSRKQIMELSEKYRISASEIIKWLRGEHVPVLIKRTRNRTKKKSIEKAKQGKIDVEEVHRLYFDEGLSMLEVGKHLGFKSTKAIQRIFKEQGWISRQGGSQRKDVSLYEIYRLYYDERKTLKEIAKIVEMDRHTIGSILKERGWETRRTAAIREMRVKEKSRNTKIEKTVKTRTKQSEKIKPRGKKTTKKKSEKTKSTEGSTKKQPKRIVAPKKLKKKIGRIDPYDVYQLYIIGKSTLGETAEKLGLKTVRPIRRILKDNGWKVKHHEKIDYDEIYKLHSEDGLSLGRIGKIVGLTASTIRKAFKERGWETKRISINREPPDIEKVFSLYYEEGLTKEEVAEELNASDSTIRRIFREMGWPSKIRKFETDSKRKVANEEKKKEIARRTIELREKLFGVNCKICGVSKEEKTLIVHRKDGTEHERDILWRVRFLRTVKPDEWASLCHSCHPGVHWMMDTFKLSYKDIKGIYVSNHKKKEAKEKQFYKQDPNAQVSERYQQIKQGNLDVDVDLRRLLFGETCFFCGVHYSEKTLVTHRKDGRKHRNYLTAAEKSLSKLNPEEWTSLCKRCHRETHWAMDTLLMDWKEFEDLKQRK